MDYGNAPIELLIDEIEDLQHYCHPARDNEEVVERRKQVRAEIIRRTQPAAQPAKETT